MMLRVHRPDGTPVLIDHGPASARHGKVTFAGDGTACVSGTLIIGDSGSEKDRISPESKQRNRDTMRAHRARLKAARA